MSKNTQKNKNEIDIMELIYIIWNGRFKIFLAIIISLMFFASNQIFQKQQSKVFVATTDVDSIEETEFGSFFVFQKITQSLIKTFNNNSSLVRDNTLRADKFTSDIFEISKKNLLEVYLNKLDRKIFFEKAIHKFELLDANNYKDQDAYNEAVIKLASSVKIEFKKFNDSSIIEKKNQLTQIVFSYNNSEKWKNVLIYVDKLANIAIREDLIIQFDTLILYAKKKREFEHQDLVIQIENAISDYERTTFDRITFLKEQSAIARKLGIKKNTIEVLTFDNNKSTIFSDVKTDSPFYLRGYEAINKEIELVESRLNDNKKAFINGLFELEKKLRSIEQSKTLERLEKLFYESLPDEENFYAARLKIVTTNYKYQDKRTSEEIIKYIGFGLIVGVFFVFISNALRPKKISRKK